MEEGVINISAQELRTYMAGHDEASYQLVDVRQPHEYGSGHLPGALLIPVGEVPARLAELPVDRDLIFYCHSGRRSQMAALFTAARPYREGRIYNLSGGILAWQGRKQGDFPDLRGFDQDGAPAEVLLQAMDLERGAFRFYRSMVEVVAFAPVLDILELLAGAEEGHARLLYRYWCNYQEEPASFATVYGSLAGEILEGGQSVDDCVAALAGQGCLLVVEAALSIEYAAYDLYRNLAHRFAGSALEVTFLAIAQAEKEHMRLAASMASRCPH